MLGLTPHVLNRHVARAGRWCRVEANRAKGKAKSSVLTRGCVHRCKDSPEVAFCARGGYEFKFPTLHFKALKLQKKLKSNYKLNFNLSLLISSPQWSL